MPERTLLLLSGGLDSTVLAYELKSSGGSVRALYVNFGKSPTSREIRSAKKTALSLGMPLEIADFHGIVDLLRGILPPEQVKPDELDVGADRISGFGVPLAIASYYAQAADFQDLHVGIIREQIDARPTLANFISDWPKVIQMLNPKATPFTLSAPFASLAKEEVIERAVRLNVPFQDTWSCYNEGPQPCGTCGACIARQNAFAKAGYADIVHPAEDGCFYPWSLLRRVWSRRRNAG